METLVAPIEQWRTALPHRAESEVGRTAARLEACGVTPAQVVEATRDLGDVLGRRLSDGDTVGLDVAVLLAELSAFISYAHERAASMRRAAFRGLLGEMSLVELAQVMGTSRQAVHKSTSLGREPSEYVATLSDGARSLGLDD